MGDIQEHAWSERVKSAGLVIFTAQRTGRLFSSLTPTTFPFSPKQHPARDRSFYMQLFCKFGLRYIFCVAFLSAQFFAPVVGCVLTLWLNNLFSVITSLFYVLPSRCWFICLHHIPYIFGVHMAFVVIMLCTLVNSLHCKFVREIINSNITNESILINNPSTITSLGQINIQLHTKQHTKYTPIYITRIHS